MVYWFNYAYLQCEQHQPLSSSFILCSIATAVVLGVVYGLTNTFQPIPDDVFRYGIRELSN